MSMGSRLPSDFLTGLPKCELHVHLEGTLEEPMAELLAERHGLASASSEATRPAAFDGLGDFLARYYSAMAGLRSEADFYALTSAYLERARLEGVVYAEMFFDPQAHTGRGVDFETVVTGIHRAQKDARSAGGPDSRLIMCFLRDEPVESAEATLEQSLAFRQWILGVGLDSDERGNPPAKFSGVFERAKAMGYRATMHCDPRQEDSIAHLWQCLELIEVERIDHGVECLADERLVDELARRRIGLTVCPLSNLRLYGELMGGAVHEMLERQLLVTINSDDPAYFGGYIADNYRAVQEEAALHRKELADLARNSFEAAWLPAEQRSRYLEAVEEFVNPR